MERNTTYQHWRVVATLCGYTIPDNMERPIYVGDKPCPENLNTLTIGQLIELGQVDGADADYRIAEIVLGFDKTTTDKCRAVEVVPFLSWVGTEIKKINRQFETISHKPTAKERQAGVERLQFGLFGMLDWFAKRMGITNHDDVLGVPWLRIYKCMDMDNQTQQYQQRLNDISMREVKTRRRR